LKREANNTEKIVNLQSKKLNDSNQKNVALRSQIDVVRKEVNKHEHIIKEIQTELIMKKK